MKPLCTLLSIAAVLAASTAVAIYAVESQKKGEAEIITVHILADGKIVAVITLSSNSGMTMQSENIYYDKSRLSTILKGNVRIQVPSNKRSIEVTMQEAEVLYPK